MFKKILKSKILKFVITIMLFYFAFRKVEVKSMLQQLIGIDLFFLISMVAISILTTLIAAYRWSLLIIKKPTLSDIFVFAKSAWSASFYGLFVPTSAAGDVFKWIIIDEKYPKIPKSKLAGSILLDRFVGMTMLVLFGFISQFFARYFGVEIPFVIRLGFFVVFGGCIFIYGLIFSGKTKLLFKIKWLEKLKNIGELVEKENSVQILKCLSVSIISDLLWIWQAWMISQYFGANLSFVEILIYLPTISTILILPISIAGFGAREQLYLYFLGNSSSSPESLLLTSTFMGIMGILISLWGGIISLTPEYRRRGKIR